MARSVADCARPTGRYQASAVGTQGEAQAGSGGQRWRKCFLSMAGGPGAGAQGPYACAPEREMLRGWDPEGSKVWPPGDVAVGGGCQGGLAFAEQSDGRSGWTGRGPSEVL